MIEVNANISNEDVNIAATDAGNGAETIADGTVLTEQEFSLQLAKALADLQKQQEAYKKARGHKALASMIGSAFLTIEFILANIDEEVRNLILSQYQQKPATGTTSRYSPWIGTMWGEDKQGGSKVQALDGQEYPAWEPNKSMAVYFHTMEWLCENGFGADSNLNTMVDKIMKKGGSQKVANDRKAAIANRGKPAREEVEKKQRELFLSDGPAQPINLDTNLIALPEGAGQFINLLVERTEAGDFIVRGVSDVDATAKLTKLAAGAYDKLAEARRQAEERARLKEEVRAEMEAQRAAEAVAPPEQPVVKSDGNTQVEAEPTGSPDSPMRVSPEQIAAMAARLKAKHGITQG